MSEMGMLQQHDIGVKMAGARWAEMLYFSRVAVALIIVSIGGVAQASHGNAYFCPLIPKDKNPFLSLMAVEQPSSTIPQHGFDLTRVIPPPEFRRHRLVKERAVSPKTSFWPPEPPLRLAAAQACESTHTDVQGSIH